MKRLLIKLHWLLSAQLGIDPRRFWRSLRGLPAYARDLCRFRNAYKGKLTWKPCLHDRFEEGGITKSEYFWQDLVVARWIHAAAPRKHVDVGSRVDGFVAHVAGFRDIEVLDVRPITASIPGIGFRQADLMAPESIESLIAGGYCDSLSCLHALEHFGLGRYGDPIDPKGYEKGIANMARLLKKGGVFYLSVPIGRERVEFNAHWVFDPRTIVQCALKNELEMSSLTVFSSISGIEVKEPSDTFLQELAGCEYNLGIFVFKKQGSSNDETF